MTETSTDATDATDTTAPHAWARLGPLMDLVTPMTLRVAATLGIADLLGDDTVHLDDLAARSGTDADALGRLLRHLVAHGVFTEPAPDRFAVDDTAKLLRSDHPASMRTWLNLDDFGGRMDLAFTGLMHTVRTGEPAWETVFGAPFWQHLAGDQQLAASFDAAMSSGAEYVADAAGGYDWSTVTHVADVGGGRGTLLAQILRANPELRATLVDLPETVGRGRELFAGQGLAERCTFAGQSFFDPLPPGADVYVLSGVVHDWPDAEATAILRRCAEAAGAGGRVLVIEGHGTTGDDPVAFAEMNLRMLVLAGGKERTPEDYSALVATAGLRVEQVRSTALGHTVIECVQN